MNAVFVAGEAVLRVSTSATRRIELAEVLAAAGVRVPCPCTTKRSSTTASS